MAACDCTWGLVESNSSMKHLKQVFYTGCIESTEGNPRYVGASDPTAIPANVRPFYKVGQFSVLDSEVSKLVTHSLTVPS